MQPRKRLAEAARALAPLEQGHLDGLCGLYSILNALQLALYPNRLLVRDLRPLFLRGATYLQKRRRLLSTLRDGMHDELWLDLGIAIIGEANAQLGTGLRLEVIVRAHRVRDARTALRSIRGHLRQGRPVLLIIGGLAEHATVAFGYSRTRLRLFDSDGYR